MIVLQRRCLAEYLRGDARVHLEHPPLDRRQRTVRDRDRLSGRRHADVVQQARRVSARAMSSSSSPSESPSEIERSTTRAVPPREYGSRVSSASASALRVSKNRSCDSCRRPCVSQRRGCDATDCLERAHVRAREPGVEPPASHVQDAEHAVVVGDRAPRPPTARRAVGSVAPCAPGPPPRAGGRSQVPSRRCLRPPRPASWSRRLPEARAPWRSAFACRRRRGA